MFDIKWDFQTVSILALACLDLIIFILTLVKKRNKVKLTLTDVYDYIPTVISYAERIIGAGKGTEKLAFCLTLIKDFMLSHGYSLKDFEDHDFSSYIEEVLSTPQKKNEGGNL